MVRRRQDAGAARDRGGARTQDGVRAAAMGSDVLQLDGQYPAVVRVAANLVGSSDSGLVRPGRQRSSLPRPRTMSLPMRSPTTPRSKRSRAEEGHDIAADPERRARFAREYHQARRGRARHLVLFGAVAVLDAGLAGRDAGAEALLSDQRAGHRLRHHLLLGRAHDDDGTALQERGAVSRRLYPRAGARCLRRENVEVEG